MLSRIYTTYDFSKEGLVKHNFASVYMQIRGASFSNYLMQSCIQMHVCVCIWLCIANLEYTICTPENKCFKQIETNMECLL